VNVCPSRLPPAGCRVDDGDSPLAVADCLLWPESAPVVPEPCAAVGFRIAENCANVAGGCTGPNDLYQELYSVWGETAHCCRCTVRRPDDPLLGESCPSSWAAGPDACYTLAIGDCKGGGGLFSTTLDPKCCVCEDPTDGSFSWDDFTAWVENACLATFPGASEIDRIADRAEARAIGAYMSALARRSCDDRAVELEDALFRDATCTHKYTTAGGIQVGCTVESPQCGLPGHPIRARALSRPEPGNSHDVLLQGRQLVRSPPMG
jgi:hypothetical protein